MEALKVLKKKRGAAKRKLTNYIKLYDAMDKDNLTENSICQLQSKYSSIDKIVASYEEVHDEMLAAAYTMEDDAEGSKTVDTLEDDLAAFSETIVDLKFNTESLFKKWEAQKIVDGGKTTRVEEPPNTPNHLPKVSSPSPTPVAESKTPDDVVKKEETPIVDESETRASLDKSPIQISPPESASVINRVPYDSIRLPKITLPTFDGNINNWLGFRDLFRDLVVANPTIADIQKYYYLDGVLVSDARRTIANIEFSSAGFQLAWDALISKYDDKKTILDNTLKSFFGMRVMAKESKHELSRIVDESQNHLRALKKLGIEMNDVVVVFTLKQKLDNETRKMWENEDTSKVYPTLDSFMDFLHRRCRALNSMNENVPKMSSSSSSSSHQHHHRKHSSSAFAATEIKEKKCLVCGQFHAIEKCTEFLNLVPEKRFEKIKGLRLCINCFKPNHMVYQCHSKRCSKCNRKHNILLHLPEREAESSPKPIPQTAETSTSMFCKNPSQVILSTAQVLIADSNGGFHVCRALLDSASQSNFVTSELAAKLSFSGDPVVLQINGLGSTRTDVDKMFSTTIKSRCNKFVTTADFYVVPQISNCMPNQFVDFRKWALPQSIHLADTRFNIPAKIDLLLGVDIFYKVLKNGRYEIDEKSPILQETTFGWVVAGRMECEPSQTFFLSEDSQSINDAKVDELIEKFWIIESCLDKPPLSTEELKCEQIFEESHKRNEDGRYVVDLPLKQNHVLLGESKPMALKRFRYLESRFEKNDDLKREYVKFMREYESLGHMKVCSSPSKPSNIPEYFLPHHAVFKPSSTSTKIRVVFDASAKTSSNLSLNDVLMTGPTVQNDLFTIILNFRMTRYVYTTDVVKMYRQFLINEEHTRLQKIVWRESPDDIIREYELLTVTYGTSAAPYLATKSLVQLAKDESDRFPLAAKVIINNSYVDDILGGTNTIEEALEVQTQLIQMLKGAQLQLSKWMSNDLRILDSIPTENREILDKSNETIKTLGLTWNTKSDFFSFIISDVDNESSTTKRILLSNIARLFDPLGLISPVIVVAKIIMQRTWLAKIDWNDDVPNEIQVTWNAFRESLPLLNAISIPRWVVPNSLNFTLHGFADASQLAYGACIYFRTIDESGQVNVRLVTSKSRVAPLSTTQIPRLELNAAQLLAKLVNKVISALGIKSDDCTLWSDSSIVLAWLKLQPIFLTPYVAHRVSDIQQSTSNMKWRHVDSKNNAADLLSRGCMPADFCSKPEWFNGPNFLSMSEDQWPSKYVAPKELPEMRKNVQVFLNLKLKKYDDVLPLNRHSSIVRIVRIIAWCRRFFYNWVSKKRVNNQQPADVKQLTLDVHETSEATKNLHRMVQRQLFPDELRILLSKSELPSNNPIIRLNPFVDEDLLLRVGGRLQHSDTLPNDQKQPVLLKDHHITKLLIRRTHSENLHAGISQTLATIRQNFWVINGRRLVKGIIHSCIPCQKISAKTMSQIMGNLPTSRIQFIRPFHTTGLDFCGPFSVRYKNQRKETYAKVFICIFVCFATKAVHLEVVEDASSDAFIACLKRFVARRGKPSQLWSDNGSNFVGAFNILQDLKRMFEKESVKIINFCTTSGIQWKFIPPRTPHWGGLWESGVKVVKTHLKKVVGSQILTLELLYTLVVQIEGVMNSRPLFELSSDPNDFRPLTPGNFLTMTELNQLPEPDITNTPINRLNQWQQITRMVQLFKKRFELEYLNTLQQRSKWSETKPNIKPNEMVLVKNDGMVGTQWILGRVDDVFYGADNKVRCVQIRTKNGLIKRGITKVARLLIDDNDVDLSINQGGQQ